jgi:hypothetical protein
MIMVELLNKIDKKLIELGFESEEYGPLLADLYDIFKESQQYQQLIYKFTELNVADNESVLETLVELQTSMEHFHFHIKSAEPLLNKVLSKL